MGRVVIEMDPHKRSVTIEVMAGDESVLAAGQYATDAEGYRAMVAEARLRSVMLRTQQVSWQRLGSPAVQSRPTVNPSWQNASG